MADTNKELEKSGTKSAGQIGRRIFRATGALMIIQVILKFFGLIEKMILGHLFGTTYLTDAYMTARDVSAYMLQFVDNVLMHSFVPVFIQRMRESGEKDAWRFASTIINLLLILVGGIALMGIFFTPQILPFFVPNWFAHPGKYDPQLIPLTIQLTRYMLVAMIFLAVTSLTYSLLNSYKQFALPASGDFALKGVVLVAALLFAKEYGPYALALGFVVGAVAKLLLHSVGIGKRFLLYRPVIDVKHPGLRRFGLLIWPLFIGMGISIFRQIMDQRFSSHLAEGGIASIKFARQLTDTPVTIFSLAFGIALFPFLADIAVAGDKARLRAMLMTATRMMFLIFMPLATMIIILREPIVFAVFGANAQKTAAPLQVFALGMIFGALETIVLQFFYAMSNTLWPMLIAALLVPLHIATVYLGIFEFNLGAVSLALALLIYKGSKVVVLYSYIRRKFTSLEGRSTIIAIAKMVLAMMPLLVMLLLAVHFLPRPSQITGKLQIIFALFPFVIIGGIGLLSYFWLLHLLKVEEMSLLVDKVRAKLKRPSVMPNNS